MTLRLWRVQPWSGNRLMRVSDRLEGVLRIVAAMVMLAAVPVAGAAGTAHYTAAVGEVRAENAAKTGVTAIVVEDPVLMPAVSVKDEGGERFEARVRWTHAGTTGEATREVSVKVRPGDGVPMWIGPDGRPTAPPLPGNAAAARGIGFGVGLLVQVWAGALAVVAVTRCVLGSRNRERWAQEWRTVSRPIGHDKP
ncbi:hypothetical protein BJY24_005455 [Nocardia transvalensis]|uniref:Uncharacterized protein n=1 Tax=Nocardia transvalensis TaxID=37333 RepID=A0A7W9PIX4_9NOCA|nr:hypothetical protein [Nocardia transvalensis]MBB5916543.1 hypothetical protein [Nocardia transvalensis]